MKKFLLVLIVITIILSCGFLGFCMLDNFGVLKVNSVDNINSDTWNIEVEATEPLITGSSIVNHTEVKNTDIKVNGNLKNMDDTITYELKIKNSGSIDAYLYSIINNDENIQINYLNEEEELENGFVLKSGETVNVKMVLQSKNDSSYDFNLDTQLIFNQYNK